MQILKKNKIAIVFWVIVASYIFIMTTPNNEMLKGLEVAATQNKVYDNAYSKVMDLINTKETKVNVLQKKIDDIRLALDELKKDESYDEDLQNTINTWSTEADKVQSKIIKELDKRIDEFEKLNDDKKLKEKEEIKNGIDSLMESHVEYPKSQGNRLLEKFKQQIK